MIIGLTGGIGSGKTTVAKMFHELGVPIYVSDIEAKKLMVTNAKLITEIKALLGDEAYNGNELNRTYISEKVFKNKNLLNQLNALVHPAVADGFIKWKAEQNSLYVIKESAILFESGSYKNCDLIITVTAPLEVRVGRVVLRDKVTRKQVLHRVMNQSTDDDKIDRSNFIINNITFDGAEEQVAKIHRQILNKIESSS